MYTVLFNRGTGEEAQLFSADKESDSDWESDSGLKEREKKIVAAQVYFFSTNLIVINK